MRDYTPATATLLDVLIDGFEKNEVWEGFHRRRLPLPDEATAIARFGAFVADSGRWKGTPLETLEENGRRLARWEDLEIRQAGRGIMVRVRASGFTNWWHDKESWANDPLDAVDEWVREEKADARK